MINFLNVFIIDDHPLITDAYKSAFLKTKDSYPELHFNIEIFHGCDTAYEAINNYHSQNKKIDVVFLDLRLPPSTDGKIISGEDIGLHIKNKFPDTKIIIATTLNDNYRIHAILKSINPDGFLIKNDIDIKEILLCIEEVIFNPPYYSKTVIKILRNNVANDYLLDNIDRKILYELSMGTKMKDLPAVIPLSIAGIEKRKRNLKLVFDVKESGDRMLILKAKEKGFI